MNAIRYLSPLLLLALVACAPAPIYKPSASNVNVPPQQVAATPDRFGSGDVIWGGRIVQVNNLADHSEVEVLAYPLDSSQRPKASDTGNGRFIVLLPGYAEPLNYPAGRLMTVAGRLDGTRTAQVGQAPYTYPVVSASSSHVWTQAEMAKGKNNVSFGLGLGVGIH
jgi:outer membrane lipoprotein